MRAWLSYRNNISAKTAITSVVLDRAAALAGVAALVLLTAPFFLYRVGASLPLLVPIFVSMIGLVAIFVAAQFERLPIRWLRFRALGFLQGLGGLRPSGFFEADQRVAGHWSCDPRSDGAGSCAPIPWRPA